MAEVFKISTPDFSGFFGCKDKDSEDKICGVENFYTSRISISLLNGQIKFMGGKTKMGENINKLESKQTDFSKTRFEQLNKQPILETQITQSEDGKWIIHKTIITDIKPILYFKKFFY